MTRLPTGASRWQQVKRLLERALELPPDEQESFLDDACAGDPSLRHEVESLIAHASADNFLEKGIARAAADALDLKQTVSLEGHVLGSWKIERRIGEGGMGAVYLAERADGEFSKQVALKVVRQRVATESALRRFRTERQILADIDHPNIARLIDAGTTDDGLPYLVMEYVEGDAIDVYCDAQRLSIAQRLELFESVCNAVQLAHDRHVVHRDLKPSNVLITGDGSPKLLDFGIAKLLAPELLERSVEVTAEFQRLMTPAFASPEQIRGEPVTPASDVYSLGVILYGLVCGHSPYDEGTETSASTEQIVCELEPPVPSRALRQFAHTVGPDGESIALTPEAVSTARGTDPDALCALLEAGLDATVMKALAKKPADRYESAAALGAAIGAYVQHGAAPAVAPVGAARAPFSQASTSPPVHERDTTLPPPATLFEWGHLQVLRKVGEGMFGEVYECRDPSLDTTVALKLFRSAGDGDTKVSSEIANRILREGQMLARVRHPNVLRVYGVGVHDEIVGLWMEFIDGRNLEELLEVQGRFGAREACLVGIDLCSALAAVHGQGVVHRDIKAQNVIREEGGRIILTDFGSGRDLVGETPLAREGAVGTPLYMAPEVLRGGVATVRSDIYSLGVLLFRLVAGKFPLQAEAWPDLIEKHECGEVPLVRDLRPDLRPRVAQVIDTALSTEPERRYASVGEMQRALEVASDMSTEHQVSTTTDPGLPLTDEEAKQTIRKMARSVRALGMGAGALMLLAVLGLVTSMAYRRGLRIPLGFWGESPLGLPAVGFSASVPLLVNGIVMLLQAALVVGPVVLVVVLVFRAIPPSGRAASLRDAVVRIGRRVQAVAPETAHAVVLFGAVIAVALAVYEFRDLLDAVMLMSDTQASRDLDLSVLSNVNNVRHHWFTRTFATIVLGIPVILLLIGYFCRAAPKDRSLLLMLRAAIFAVVIFAAMVEVVPWRLIWDSFHPAVRVGGATGYIIVAHVDGAAWVYFPDENSSQQVDLLDPSLAVEQLPTPENNIFSSLQDH